MNGNFLTVMFAGPPVESFDDIYKRLCKMLLASQPVHTGEWQSLDTRNSKVHSTYELLNVTLGYNMPTYSNTANHEIWPNQPWADEHFDERVSGFPYNPPPSHVNWPWARHNVEHMTPDGKFSHTYPERMWPKHAGPAHERSLCSFPDEYFCDNNIHKGIRFRYGDLTDVINLLVRRPLTRQAYLPIWFPEDTGAHHGQRVPCTLGYHFMIRDGLMHCWYYIRSCDIIRHFRDDVYLTTRLVQWVCNELNDRKIGECNEQHDPECECSFPELLPGTLVMNMSSLHAFVGDERKLQEAANGS